VRENRTQGSARGLPGNGQSYLDDEMKIRAPHIAIIVLVGVLSVSLLASLVLAARSYWRINGIGGWRDEVYGLVSITATTQAMDDYRAGHLRLYTFGGENEKREYTGTNDGPFEVWIPRYYPLLGRAHRYSTEQFIDFYNRKMRYMHTHPEKFPRNKDVQLDASHEPPPAAPVLESTETMNPKPESEASAASGSR